MIEILAIFSQLIFFLLIFSFPFNPYFLNNTLKPNHYYFGFFDTVILNGVIILNILLFCSFINLELNHIFYALILASLIFNALTFGLWKKYLINEKKLIIFFVVICLCLFLGLAESLKFEWDGIAHWFFKTKSFYEGYNIQNLQELPAAQYPHLGNYLWAFFWRNSIVQYEYLGRLIYIFFYVISIFSIVVIIFKKNNHLVLFSLIMFILIFTYDEYLLGGYQEYLIFSFAMILSKLILNYLDTDSTSFKQLLLIIFAGNLLMWFKDEGLFYFLIIMFIFQFFIKNISSRISVIILAILLVLFQYFIQNYLINIYGLQNSLSEVELSNILNLTFILKKIFIISKYFIISFAKYPIWIVILFSIFLLFKYNIEKKILYFYLLFLGLTFSFLYCVYIFHPHSSEFLLKVTLDRLIFQTSGFFVSLFIIATNFLYDHKSINS